MNIRHKTLHARALILAAIHLAILFLCFVVETTTEKMPFIDTFETSFRLHRATFFNSVCTILLPTTGLFRAAATVFRPASFITLALLSTITSALSYGYVLALLSFLAPNRNA